MRGRKKHSRKAHAANVAEAVLVLEILKALIELVTETFKQLRK